MKFWREAKSVFTSAAVVVGLGLLGGSAHAVTIPPAVLNSPDVGDIAIAPPIPAAGTAYVVCSLGCTGWNGSTFGIGAFSSAVKADVYDMQWTPNAANELEELKFVSGIDTLTGFNFISGGTSPIDIIVEAGTYLKLKFGNFGNPGVGNASAFFYVAAAQTLTYYQNGQRGGGLSHAASVVPIPAGGVLLLTALGGLIVMRRRCNA